MINARKSLSTVDDKPGQSVARSTTIKVPRIITHYELSKIPNNLLVVSQPYKILSLSWKESPLMLTIRKILTDNYCITFLRMTIFFEIRWNNVAHLFPYIFPKRCGGRLIIIICIFQRWVSYLRSCDQLAFSYFSSPPRSTSNLISEMLFPTLSRALMSVSLTALRRLRRSPRKRTSIRSTSVSRRLK